MPPVSMAEERRVYLSLKNLFQGLINDVRNGYVKPGDMQQAARKFLASEEVDRYLRVSIWKMTRRLRIDSAREWKEAMTKGSNSAVLHEALKHEMDGPVGTKVWEIIANNVAYIKTVPEAWGEYITKYTARETMKGRRPEDIEEDLRKVIPRHMAKNLKCIARTECAKANAAIVQARAEAVGIKCYFWKCVKDNRVRDTHWDMDGILVFYDDPPSPEELFGGKPYGRYHAGNTFNCRCYQAVVVDSRFLPDRFRYYRAGAIHWTTRASFLREFGNIA